MGGHGFSFTGDIADEDVRARLIAESERRNTPSLLSRLVTRVLFGPARSDAADSLPLWTSVDDEVLHEAVLEGLLEWVAGKRQRPWRSTQYLLEQYVSEASGVVFAGERAAGGDPWRWRVDVVFSGCAGLGEVSARVMAHWTSLWWQAERDSVTTLLREVGFAVGDLQEPVERMVFLPVGRHGYAELNLQYDAAMADDEWPTYPFEIDAAAEEAGASDLCRLATERFASLFDDGACRCQLCAPDFDEATVRRALRSDDET